ncbi:NAD(P)-dependent oxidoreductase [Streptomyces syringium]|uniref:NAD(P)-dependent oxidoreductase n=1 Tax=Streptomyces syringium TaxID=76729 RepID=UPI003AAC9F0B
MTTQHSTAPIRTAVTVVGLGPMGLALAATLLEQGHPTTVWNRTPEKADGLVAQGARRAATIADAVAASPVTVICLKDYEAMYETLDSASAVLAGRVLVNLSSGTPTEAREAVAWAGERKADYLDGAIMVPPPAVGHPDSVFLYSGSREVFDDHRPTLAAMGGPTYLGPDPSLAVLYNTALLDFMYASLNGFLHAAALVGTANVEVAKFAELAIGWFLPAVVGATVLAQAPQLDKGDYPGDQGTMEMNLNALEHIARTSVERNVSSDQPELMKALAERAIAEGRGGQNYLAVFELLKKPTPSS